MKKYYEGKMQKCGKYEGTKKKCEEKMEKYEESMKKYGRNMKKHFHKFPEYVKGNPIRGKGPTGSHPKIPFLGLGAEANSKIPFLRLGKPIRGKGPMYPHTKISLRLGGTDLFLKDGHFPE